MTAPQWKSTLCASLVEANRTSRAFSPMVNEYQKLLTAVATNDVTISELQRQNNTLKQRNSVLEEEAVRLRASGSEETRKRIETMETKLHNQQEELTAAYRTKLENTEEMLRLNQLVQQQESQITTYKAEMIDLKEIIQERNTRQAGLEAQLVEKSNALITLKQEYDAEKAGRTQATDQFKLLETQHNKLVQRWLEKVQEDAELMNQQLEVDNMRKREQRQSQLHGDAMKNYGAHLDVCDVEFAMVPEKKKLIIEAHGSDGNDVCFSVSGRMLASGSSDKDVKIFDPSGALQTTMTGPTQAVMCVDFSHNEELVLGACNDNTIRVWKPVTASVVHALNGHQNKVYSTRFCADGHRVVSGSCDRTLKCWDLNRGYCTRTILCISSCNTVSPDGTGFLVASGHFDKSVKLWDLRDGKEIAKLEEKHSQQITHVEFSLDGNFLLSSGRDGVLKVSDIRTHETLTQLAHGNLTIPLNWAKPCLSPDSRYAAVGGHDGSVFVFDIQQGKVEKILTDQHTCAVSSCSWSAVNSSLASIDKSGKIVIWGP